MQTATTLKTFPIVGLGFANGNSPISSFSVHGLAQIWSNQTKEKPEAFRRWHFVPRANRPATSVSEVPGH
jgi:hypothetical protein